MKAAKTTIGLSMIVRDQAELLRRCLESAREATDEIVVADTGSSDGSREVAREFGARVVEIPWRDDFAEARNRALAEMQSSWVLSLDADEMLDPAAGPEMRRLAAGRDAAGYQVPIRNYLRGMGERIWDRAALANDGLFEAARSYPAYVEHENVRLFRRDPQVYFVGRVHESVGPRIEARNLKLGRTEFRIHHFGLAVDDATKERKNHFYRELGRKKAAEMPDNAQAQLELGLVELDNFGNVAESLACFARACELNPRLGVAWFFAGVAQLRLGQAREALQCLKRAESCGRTSAASAELRGDAHYELGEFALAAECYREALRGDAGTALLEEQAGAGAGAVRRRCGGRPAHAATSGGTFSGRGDEPRPTDTTAGLAEARS